MKKIIAEGRYWVCENLDLLSPIIECGTEILFDDDTRELYADGEKVPKYEKCSEVERKQFFNRKGFVFVGDEVFIDKGKLKGLTKTISSFFTYVVPRTFGKKYVEYISFEDGERTPLKNCTISNRRVLGEYKCCNIKIGGRL